MTKSTYVWTVIVVLVLLIGGYFWWASMQAPAPATSTAAGPQGAAGINGSANQGNLGQPNNGQVQSPSNSSAQGDGSNIADNLTLGTDANATIGTYLIGYNAKTLYIYSKDQAGTSTCYGNCAKEWIPYVVPTGMTLNLEADVKGQANTLKRADGTSQVTYNGLPLYFYAGDTATEETNGNGIGKVWFVAKP